MAVVRYLVAVLILVGVGTSCRAGADLDPLVKAIVAATQRSDNASFIKDNFAKDVADKLSPGAEAIDFDVFTYAQDPDCEQIRNTIKSEVKQSGATSAVVDVTFIQYEGDAGIVEYHLKTSGGRWLIDDVTYPNDSLSLRSALGLK